MLLGAAAVAPAEVIDRIAVSVGNRAITVSDIERQLRLGAFLSGVAPDLSAEARRKMAETLVDQKLVSRELETARYPEPSASDLDEAFEEFKRSYFTSDEEYRKALAGAGLTETDVKAELLWQRRWLGFVAARFRPAVQVSEDEIREYYEKSVLPVAKTTNPGAAFSIDEFRGAIVTKLTGDRVDQAMEQWLAETRGRIEIVFHDEALQ